MTTRCKAIDNTKNVPKWNERKEGTTREDEKRDREKWQSLTSKLTQMKAAKKQQNWILFICFFRFNFLRHTKHSNRKINNQQKSNVDSWLLFRGCCVIYQHLCIHDYITYLWLCRTQSSVPICVRVREYSYKQALTRTCVDWWRRDTKTGRRAEQKKKEIHNTSIRAVYKIYRPLVIQYDYFARIKERKKSVEHIYRHLTCIFSNLIHSAYQLRAHTYTNITHTQPNIYETRSKHTEENKWSVFYFTFFCLWYFDHGCCCYDCRNHSFWNSSYFKMVDVWFSSWFSVRRFLFDSISNSQPIYTCL